MEKAIRVRGTGRGCFSLSLDGGQDKMEGKAALSYCNNVLVKDVLTYHHRLISHRWRRFLLIPSRMIRFLVSRVGEMSHVPLTVMKRPEADRLVAQHANKGWIDFP